MRIFHGISGAAGQPWMLSQAEKDLGVISDYHRIENCSPYYSDSTYQIRKSDLRDPKKRTALIEELAESYDIFNFYSRTFITARSPDVGADLLLLKKMGKKIVFKFRGSEARLETSFRNQCPYHYADDFPKLFQKINEEIYTPWINFIRDISDEIQVPDPELESYVPGAAILNRLVSRELFESEISNPKKKITIVHAPTRRIIKGTPFILETMDKIKKSHPHVDFILVENMSNREALKLYKTCDILIDQLRIGWYGVLACEAMALGKAVVSYIRDDLTHTLPHSLPLENANKDNLYDCLTRLINDANYRLELGHRARAYAIRNHHPEVIALKSLDRYKNLATQPHRTALTQESVI